MMEGQQIGPYHLEKLLGAEGFGGVFLANVVPSDVDDDLTFSGLLKREDNIFELRCPERVRHRADET
jgi:hypothetical protein